MSGVRMLHFLKDWWKVIQIHQYYNTMYGCNRDFFKFHYLPKLYIGFRFSKLLFFIFITIAQLLILKKKENNLSPISWASLVTYAGALQGDRQRDSRTQGRIQDFHLGGRKRLLCARTHITSAKPNSLSAGVQGPLKGPGSSRVVLMLSRAIWALFLSILIKMLGKKKHSWSNFRGGGGTPVVPPLDPPLEVGWPVLPAPFHCLHVGCIANVTMYDVSFSFVNTISAQIASNWNVWL